VTLYSGTLIVGDGQVIENAAFTVDEEGGRFLAVGAASGWPSPRCETGWTSTV
jgi:hypothetical protein